VPIRIQRADFHQGAVDAFAIKGKTPFVLDEVYVPTVQIMDLEISPYTAFPRRFGGLMGTFAGAPSLGEKLCKLIFPVPQFDCIIEQVGIAPADASAEHLASTYTLGIGIVEEIRNDPDFRALFVARVVDMVQPTPPTSEKRLDATGLAEMISFSFVGSPPNANIARVAVGQAPSPPTGILAHNNYEILTLPRPVALYNNGSSATCLVVIRELAFTQAANAADEFVGTFLGATYPHRGS